MQNVGVIDNMKIKDIEKETILAFAECNMNVQDTANKVFAHRNTVVYRFQRIKEKTRLNQICFYDLIKLLEMVNKGDI